MKSINILKYSKVKMEELSTFLILISSASL